MTLLSEFTVLDANDHLVAFSGRLGCVARGRKGESGRWGSEY